MRTREYVLVFIALYVIMVLSACGSWQKTGVTTYASLQVVHEQLGKTINRLYADGTITVAEYEKIEIEYDKAAFALYQAGSVWNDMIDAGSLSRQKEYEALILKVENLMNSINEIVITYSGGN